LSVKVRRLEPEICYLFNGRDFIVNNNLSAVEYREALSLCLENDRDAGVGDAGGLPVPPVPLKKNQRIAKKEQV